MYKPDYLKEVENGAFQVENPLGNGLITIIEHYREKALQILHADKIHYSKMLEVVKEQLPEIMIKYNYAVAIGGGHPKFEATILGINKVLVVDMNTSLYEDTLKDFKEIFNLSDIQISYSDKTLSEPFEIEAPEGGCITFVHFLEHCQSWDLVKQWIEKQKHDIIIYMPCIEAAQNENWVHFHGNAVDHNVFMTAETLVNVGIKCGYKCKSLRYSDDMLVWMEKEK